MTTPTLQDPALTEVLAALHGRLGLERWIATRCEGEELVVVASHGNGVDLEAGAHIRWPETICPCMASRAGPRAAPDLTTVPAYAEAPLAVQLGVRAYLGAPILSGSRVLGTLGGLDREPQGAGLVDALPFVELCAGLIGRLWEAKRDARTDPLTGLWNRRAWEETLTSEEERCRRFGHPAAVLAIDLDHFKEVNDRYGHAEGDMTLVSLARCMESSVRGDDFAARFGGEEFALLLREGGEEGAAAVIERLRDLWENTNPLTTFSAGIAVRRSNESISQAFRRADAALYAAKNAGRNRTEISTVILA